MKGKTRVIVALALLGGLLVGLPVGAHYRAQWQLRDYKRQLKSAGERMTIVELAPPLPAEGANGSGDLTRAANRLGGFTGAWSNYPPTMRYIAPARALVAWPQDVLPTSESTNVWPGLSVVLAANRENLEGIESALQKPALVFALNYEQGFNVTLMHLPQVKSSAQLLSTATIFSLHEGRFAAARESLRALIGLAARFKDEPMMISELVRIAINQFAISASWEALQSNEWRDEGLQELQHAWASIDFLSQAEAALSMERAMGEKNYAAARESYATIAAGSFPPASGASGLAELAQMGKEVLDNPKAGLSSMAHRYPGYWGWRVWQSYDDELASDEATQAALEAIRSARKSGALVPAMKQLEQDVARIRQAHPRAGRWLGYSTARDGMNERFLGRVANCEMQRGVLEAAIALKRYQLRHGTFPADLAALAPDFVRQPPRDPMDGKPLRYKLQPEGMFLLYSVGEDGVDNGGDTVVSPGPGGFKQWWKARDAVWPLPANSEEVKTYLGTLAARRQPSALPPGGRGMNPEAERKFRERYGLVPPSTPATNSAK